MTSTTIELIEDYVQLSVNLECENNEHGTVCGESIQWVDEARAALEQRIKELERDAKRYRWLRQTQVALSLPCQTVAMLVADVTELDAAISEAALTKAVEISQEYKLP